MPETQPQTQRHNNHHTPLPYCGQSKNAPHNCSAKMLAHHIRSLRNCWDPGWRIKQSLVQHWTRSPTDPVRVRANYSRCGTSDRIWSGRMVSGCLICTAANQHVLPGVRIDDLQRVFLSPFHRPLLLMFRRRGRGSGMMLWRLVLHRLSHHWWRSRGATASVAIHICSHTHTHTQTIVLLPSTNTCKTSVIQKHHNVNHPIFFYIKWDKTLTQSINAECLSTTFLVYPVLGQALSLNSTYLGFV